MQVQATAVGSVACSQALLPYRRVKYDATYGLGYAGPEDHDLGTLRARHVVSGLGAAESAALVWANVFGTVKMVAAGALSAFDTVYGAEDGKIDDTANANPIGIAMEGAAADGDFVEVLRLPGMRAAGGDEIGGIDFFDDFLGDYPAAGTALTASPWTKVETNGDGVISANQANGVLKFGFSGELELATAALYMQNAPLDIDQNPIVEFRLAIYDIGDGTGLDINFGLADDTHATDADQIAVSAFFHLDVNDPSLKCECDDGTNETPATDTLVDLLQYAFYDFKIDVTDKSDVKFYYRAVGATSWTRLLSSTTFSMAAATGTLTPIVHVEKTINGAAVDVRLDCIRVRSGRA